MHVPARCLRSLSTHRTFDTKQRLVYACSGPHSGPNLSHLTGQKQRKSGNKSLIKQDITLSTRHVQGGGSRDAPHRGEGARKARWKIRRLGGGGLTNGLISALIRRLFDRSDRRSSWTGRELARESGQRPHAASILSVSCRPIALLSPCCRPGSQPAPAARTTRLRPLRKRQSSDFPRESTLSQTCCVICCFSPPPLRSSVWPLPPSIIPLAPLR